MVIVILRMQTNIGNIIAIKIGKATVINDYDEPGRNTNCRMGELERKARGLVAGDMNAKHQAWSGPVTDNRRKSCWNGL